MWSEEYDMWLGPCSNCKRTVFIPEDRHNRICDGCWNKHFSKEAIREKRLKKLLKKNRWSIKNIFNKWR